MYRQSIDDPETFFGNMARQFHWELPSTPVGPIYNFDLNKGPIKIDWFQGGDEHLYRARWTVTSPPATATTRPSCGRATPPTSRRRTPTTTSSTP